MVSRTSTPLLELVPTIRLWKSKRLANTNSRLFFFPIIRRNLQRTSFSCHMSDHVLIIAMLRLTSL